jgi:hypothetical protein
MSLFPELDRIEKMIFASIIKLLPNPLSRQLVVQNSDTLKLSNLWHLTTNQAIGGKLCG